MTMTTQLQQAIDLLHAKHNDDGTYTYFDQATMSHWRTTEEALTHLGKMMDDDDPDMRRDAFSHWCSSHGADNEEVVEDKGSYTWMIWASTSGMGQHVCNADDEQAAWDKFRAAVAMGDEDGDEIPSWLDIEELQDEAIEQLQAEAGEAGDMEQVALCKRALIDSDMDARLACAEAIMDAANNR